MKILHIIVGLKVGGAETMLKRLIEVAPASIGNNVVVSLTSLGVIGESLRAKGVRVELIGMSSGWSAPMALWRLVRLIYQHKPEVVQTWMYHADLLGGVAARLAGHRNVVWSVRRTELSFSDSPQTKMVMKMCALLSHWVPKKIVCVADAARQAHIAAGYCADRMVVIHNGFDFSSFAATLEQRMELRRACHFADGEMVVGTVGRFHPDKGQLNFVKAAAIIAGRQPSVRFLLVGRDCDSNNTVLASWLYEHGVQNHFILLGERDDVPVCLASMDVFCMPSRTEGFPNGLGEAMAMALPCVATRVGDTSVLTGDTVLLVPPEDEQSLANGLLTVLNLTYEQRRHMGQEARVRVLREFSIEKAAVRFKAVYREVVSGASA